MATEADPIDLLLDENGDLDVGADLALSSGIAGVVQAVTIRLQSVKGEWVFDLDDGVDWWDTILGQNFEDNAERIQFEIRNAILSTPNIVELQRLTLEFNTSSRLLTIRWKARTAFGETGVVTTVIV